MPHPQQQLDDADNNFQNGVEQLARVRAAAVLREAAKMTETGPWLPGAGSRFMTRDEADFVLDTNQGRFLIAIRRG